MKVYHVPEDLRTLIFDIDGTLYSSRQYVFEQVDVQIRHFAHVRGIPEEQARKMIADYRREWSAAHGGKKISLGNAFTAFGVSIETSVRWRNELLDPSLFLHRDLEMVRTIRELGERFMMICVTNNPVLAARKTLEAVGIADLLPDIIGLDTFYLSKPDAKLLHAAAERTGVLPGQCLSVGDRYDIDLAVALDMGMGGILVDGAEDVYELGKVLHI